MKADGERNVISRDLQSAAAAVEAIAEHWTTQAGVRIARAACDEATAILREASEEVNRA